MQSSEILRQLLSIVGTSKFTDDSRYYSKNDSNVPDLNIGSTYFYNRLRQKTPIIDRVKTVLKQIYSHVLSNMTDISDLATSEKLNSFFKEYIKIDTSCFVFWGDDSELLRKEKINSWLELLDIVLDKSINREEIIFTDKDFKEKLDQQQKAVERLCAGTHTEVIIAEQAETGALDDRMREFYCGNYYCYYAASDSENTLRGGKLKIYTDGKALKAKLILRISDDSLLDDKQLNHILELKPSETCQALNSYKAHEISNHRYSAGRCEIYTGTFKVYKTHIRIDLQHPERGYSGFILLHKIDSSTQKKLQGSPAFLLLPYSLFPKRPANVAWTEEESMIPALLLCFFNVSRSCDAKPKFPFIKSSGFSGRLTPARLNTKSAFVQYSSNSVSVLFRSYS